MATSNSNAMFGTTSSGIPLAHLDYSYIGKCTNPSELEKILKVLRSGEEGTYPELTMFTEKQLESINPKSKALRKDIPVQSYKDLNNEEREQISYEFKDWISEISQKDVLLKEDNESNPSDNDYLPPIRSAKTVGSTTSGRSQVSSDRNGTKSESKGSVPRGYHDWDKFNPDDELKALEEKEEQELKSKREKAKINTKEAEISCDVETSGKTNAELVDLADREKDKGNEAFRCGDYKESLVYYSRSIKYKPTAASYNNRAFAHLKLEKYQEAIEDCNTVIDMEPNNIKALLRRALAHKSRGEKANARQDLNNVLQIEPNNKRAKELLSELDENTVVEDEKPAKPQETEENQPKKKGKRLKIIEIENDEEPAVVAEEKKVETVVDANNIAAQSDSTDGNSISKSTRNFEDNNLVSTPEVQEDVPIKTETEVLSSSIQSEEEQPSSAVIENDPIEVSTAPSVSTPPEVVELPGIVVRAKDEGTSLYKLGRFAEASEKFTIAIEILEKDKSQFKSALSSLLNNRAACLQKIGDATGCIKDCTASLELIPDSVKPLLKRAESNELLEKYEYSYIDFSSVVLMDPNNKKAMEGKSRVGKHLNNINGSSWREKLAGVKVSSTPRSPELLNTDSSAAEKLFNIIHNNQVKTKTVTPAAPTSANSNTIKEENSSKIKEEPITKPTAPETFEQCKEKGNAFVKQGKLEEAVHCYTRCIELDSTKVAVYTNRALCYLRMEKYNLAEEDASKALDLQEDNVKALYRRALARKALQKYEEAAKDLVNLIKIEPSNTSGKKELEIVLNLCREERKAKQKVSSNSQVNTNKVKTSNKENESKAEVNKKTRRRRVQIEEVNGEEDSAAVSSSGNSSSVSKKPQDSSPKVKKNDVKQQESNKNVREEAKVKTSPSKELKKKKIKLHKATAFDFYQAWNSVKQKDLSSYADVLRQLQPAMLPKVLSNKLDADILRCIIGALSEQLLPNGEEKFSFEILQHMCKAQRFDMVMMFLDGSDTRAIRDLFSKLASARSKNEFVDNDIFNSVLKKYNV